MQKSIKLLSNYMVLVMCQPNNLVPERPIVNIMADFSFLKVSAIFLFVIILFFQLGIPLPRAPVLLAIILSEGRARSVVRLLAAAAAAAPSRLGSGRLGGARWPTTWTIGV